MKNAPILSFSNDFNFITKSFKRDLLLLAICCLALSYNLHIKFVGKESPNSVSIELHENVRILQPFFISSLSSCLGADFTFTEKKTWLVITF